MALLPFLLAVITAADPEPTKPELLRELKARQETDQKVRFELLDWMRENDLHGKTIREPAQVAKMAEFSKRMTDIDSENRDWLRGVIGQTGWPGKTQVGTDGARIAWLLVQHADKDLDFQKRCLELMKGMPEGEVEGQHIAYLTDRIRVNSGEKQLFGTQITFENGKATPKPLEKPDEVDELRARHGMPPLEEYLRYSERMMKEGPKREK